MRRGGGARARQRIGARGPRRAAREQLVRGAARPAAAAAVRAAGGGARRRRAAAAVAARGIGGRGGEGAAGAADARAQRSQRRRGAAEARRQLRLAAPGVGGGAARREGTFRSVRQPVERAVAPPRLPAWRPRGLGPPRCTARAPPASEPPVALRSPPRAAALPGGRVRPARRRRDARAAAAHALRVPRGAGARPAAAPTARLTAARSYARCKTYTRRVIIENTNPRGPRSTLVRGASRGGAHL